jgi:hypothetical protein
MSRKIYLRLESVLWFLNKTAKRIKKTSWFARLSTIDWAANNGRDFRGQLFVNVFFDDLQRAVEIHIRFEQVVDGMLGRQVVL